MRPIGAKHNRQLFIYFGKMELFYANKIEGEKLFLDEEESHHCVKVMRHKTGEKLFVTDGVGKKYEATIIVEDRRRVELKIEHELGNEAKQKYSVHIAIAPTKNIDRLEWFLEKATEIGIDEITPIICSRSERDKLRPDRLQKLIAGAMKQSLRLWIPKLNPQITVKDFLTRNSQPNTQDFIAHCQSENLPALKSLYQPMNDATILIGPEGDFTLEEIQLAQSKGFSAVSLGNHRLRTETAGLIALQTINFLNT